jgi:alkanesulfonate monooxygenase
MASGTPAKRAVTPPLLPCLPGGLDASVGRVVPGSQRRVSSRRECEGRTLRESPGLPRPANRFFPSRP